MDLSLILVVLVTVSGIIYLYDKFALEPKRLKALIVLGDKGTAQQKEDIMTPPALIDLGRSLLPVFLIVLFLRSFIVEPFRIPSGSMMPTLEVGDFILVNKFTYGLRLPVLHTKFVELNTPERGDVVVFRYPDDPSIPYIKRIVGLPGDQFEYNHVTKTLYINGEQIPQEYLGTYQSTNQHGQTEILERYQSTLNADTQHDLVLRSGQGRPLLYTWLNDKQKMVLTENPRQLTITQQQYLYSLKIKEVPQGMYVALGDNRDNSKDSRFWGLVPEENLVGKAFFIWMNFNWDISGINLSRIGTVIK